MANDIIDINVYETTETVAITVNPNLTTVNINKVTSSGGGGATNLITTQTASNFTINSDTGDDALVPLGNGTLAGATLNDYTTTEKNKLAAITGTNTGDQEIYWTKTGNDIKNNNTGNVEILGTKTAISNLAQGTIVSNVLTSSANNDALVGLDVKNIFNTGSFTGFSKLLFRISDDTTIRSTINNLGVQKWWLNDGTSEVGSISYSTPTGRVGLIFLNNTSTGRSDIRHISTGGIIIGSGTPGTIPPSQFWFYPTGNFAINQSTDEGYRLDVNGTTRLNGGVTATALVKYNSDLSSTYDNRTLVDKGYVNNTFVPYTGATTDVNLGLNDITATKLIKEGGFDYQFLKADGSVDNNMYLTSADLPSTLDLYATTTASDISGYTVLVRNIADTRYNTTAVDVSTGVITSVGQLVGSLITDANIISGNPGVFDFKTIGNISRTNGTGQAEFFFRIYKRNLAGTETLIAQSDYTLPVTNGGYVEFSATALWNDGIFLDTDRVVLKYYANRLTSPVGSDPTYKFQFGGASPVRSSAAIPTSVMPNIYLRDLADVENVDALNNEILYWNDPASLWEHSLAEDLVPLATATQKGLVSTTTQTFAGDKTFTGAIGASNLSGTNTGDNATNTQYSGLATSKQDTLQSTVNIKSINGNSILGSGDLTISGTGISSLNGLTGATQTFSILTNFTGSPSFVSTGTNHQLRLPNASPGTDYGLVTNVGQTFSGTKVFENSIEIPAPVPANPIGIRCIVLGDPQGNLIVGSTNLYPTGLEMQYVKGVTSSVQTQLDSKASIVANINNDVYSGTIVWTGGAAPTVPNHTYSLSQIGNLVTLTINLAYTTAGSSLLTGVAMELPSTAPAPALPSSATAALDVINYGSGALQILNDSPTTAFATNTLLRIKSTGVYEVFITRGAGQFRHAYATIQYFV